MANIFTNTASKVLGRIQQGLFRPVSIQQVAPHAPVVHPVFGGVRTVVPHSQPRTLIPPSAVQVVHPVTR